MVNVFIGLRMMHRSLDHLAILFISSLRILIESKKISNDQELI